jgi:hypothetical protein
MYFIKLSTLIYKKKLLKKNRKIALLIVLSLCILFIVPAHKLLFWLVCLLTKVI